MAQRDWWWQATSLGINMNFILWMWSSLAPQQRWRESLSIVVTIFARIKVTYPQGEVKLSLGKKVR
jgi:hypothetical protein